MKHIALFVYVMIGAGSALAHMDQNSNWITIVSETVTWPIDIGFIIGDLTVKAINGD